MANCYICGKSPATYRRTVVTGTSHRTSYSSRGTNWNSSSIRQGFRSVCAQCALNIDYNNKKSGGLFLSVFMGGLMILPAIFYVIGYNFFHFSSTQIWGIAFTGIATCIIGIIITNNNANKWREENRNKYLGPENINVYKSEELGINDLDKSIDLVKKIDFEDKNFAKYQEEAGKRISDILGKAENEIYSNSFDYLIYLDEVIACKNDITDAYQKFIKTLEMISKEFATITTSDAFSNFQSGIAKTKDVRKDMYDTQVEILDKFIASFFKMEMDKYLIDLKNYLENNNKEYPDDTIEECDIILENINNMEDRIDNYSSIAENKHKEFITLIKDKSTCEANNEDLIGMIEYEKKVFIENIKNCISQCKTIESKILQRKIELLQK